MSKKIVRISLFHASWCGHCTNFFPTWEKMSNDKAAQKNMEFNEYEESDLGKLDVKTRTINGVEARTYGFPTIKISINDEEFMYDGQRTPESIYRFVIDKIKEVSGENLSEMVITSSDQEISISTTPIDIGKASVEFLKGGGNKNNSLKTMNKKLSSKDLEFVSERAIMSERRKLK